MSDPLRGVLIHALILVASLTLWSFDTVMYYYGLWFFILNLIGYINLATNKKLRGEVL